MTVTNLLGERIAHECKGRVGPSLGGWSWGEGVHGDRWEQKM